MEWYVLIHLRSLFRGLFPRAIVLIDVREKHNDLLGLLALQPTRCIFLIFVILKRQINDDDDDDDDDDEVLSFSVRVL